jgi:hypothetical protein
MLVLLVKLMSSTFAEVKKIAVERLGGSFDLKCVLLYLGDTAAVGSAMFFGVSLEDIERMLWALLFTLIGGLGVFILQNTYGIYYVRKWWNKNTPIPFREKEPEKSITEAPPEKHTTDRNHL